MIKLMGDGRTDNAALFEDGFAACQQAGLASLHLDAGVYLVSRTVLVPKEISLQLEPGARIKAAFAGNLEAGTFLGNVYDPHVLNGKLNRLPSDTGGASHIPRLTINEKPI